MIPKKPVEVLNIPATPDLIDDFVSYLIESGTDIYQFQCSCMEYRKKVYLNWFKKLPIEKRQLKLDFL